MRLLQLVTAPGELLDLHPNVTVVQGLDDDRRQVLVDAVQGLARAEASPGGGLLEAHGVLFDLRTDLLGLLDLHTLDLEPVVRPGDLPTQPLTVDARELRTREQEFNLLLERIAAQAERQSQARSAVAAAAAAVEQAQRARAEADAGAARRIQWVDDVTRRLDGLAAERRRLEDELAGLAPARAAAEAARQEVEARTAEVRGRAAEAVARRDALAAERHAVSAELDPGASAAMAQAEQHLGAVMTAVEAERARDAEAQQAAPADGQPAETESPEIRLAGVDDRLEELDRLLVAIAPVDPSEVAEALALLQGGDSLEQVPSLEAMALADEIAALGPDPAEDEELDGVEGSLPDARARLDDARQALLEAEHAVRNPELDPEEVARLEAAHDELLDALDKADGRFAGARARQRVDELRAAEQVVLDRLGFTSYSDYMMGNSRLHVDPEKEAALVAARAELTAAEDHWHRIERSTDAALARAAALDRRRGLLEQARRLLGEPVGFDQVQGALRALRVPVVTAADSARRLHQALEAIGLDLGDDDLDELELELIAGAWLTEVGEADGRRTALTDEREALVAERRSLQDAVAATASSGPAPAEVDPEIERLERIAAARADLEAAEHRWLAHELAEERWGQLAAELEAAEAAARQALEASAGADAEVAEAEAVLAPLLDREATLQRDLAQAEQTEADLRAELEAAAADPANDPVALDAEIQAAQATQREAVDTLEAETRALELLDADGQAVAIEIERLQDIVTAQGTGTATPAEELEWYLLARLASQRSVSVAGSLPLLLDDALRGVEADEVGHLLDRLERMGEAVQVIIVSEDPLVAEWAGAAGSARAAVVRPGAP
jgi:hypothetical protein